jgi:hypothetical protein
MIHQRSHLRLRRILLCAVAGCFSPLLLAGSGQAQWKSLDTYRKDFLTIGSYSYITAITATDYYAYFGSSSGILRYNILNREFIEPLGMRADGLVGTSILRIAASFDDEKLWVETDFGIFLYERVFGYWSQTSDFPGAINSGSYVSPEPIHNSPFGFTYFPDGIMMSDAGRQYITEPIYQDKSGYLWMGIAGFGPARSEVNGGDLEFLPFGLLGDEVSALHSIDENLIVGGYLGASYRTGLTRINLADGTFDYIEQGVYQDFPEVDVISLGESNRAILVGTAHGLYEISKKDHTPLARYNKFNGLPNTQINASYGFGDTIIVATQSGLGILYSDTSGAVSLRKNVLPTSRVYCLEPAYPGGRRKLPKSSQVRPRYIWVGAEKGAYRLNVRTLKLKKLTDPELILESPVKRIRLRGSELWLLAQDGLVKIDVQTGESESFLEVNRFTDHTSFDVNDELIAVGTGSGLAIIPYRKRDSKGKKSLALRFTENDGLASNYITSVEFVGDFLWIGADRGLSRFWWNDPSRVY